jgi:hypothetical protein
LWLITLVKLFLLFNIAGCFFWASLGEEVCIAKTVLARYSSDETFDMGLDTGSPVGGDYASPNPFMVTWKS